MPDGNNFGVGYRRSRRVPFNEPKEHAALIFFNKRLTPEQMQEVLDILHRKNVIEKATVNDYNPDHGSPVWYIP
jgi:hypothetical protein